MSISRTVCMACSIAIAFSVIQESAYATTRYVRAGATGNGSSWSNASGSIQAMIDLSSSNDQIWVASGTYRASGIPGNVFLIESIHTPLLILGGFAGTGPNPDLRNSDPATNGTVLSGDIGIPNDPTDNSATVVKFNGTMTPTTVLDGFTITGGNGGPGAGIFLGSGSSPTIRNMRISGSISASDGGGIWVGSQSSPVIEDTTFEGNQAAGSGGGLYSRPLLRLPSRA